MKNTHAYGDKFTYKGIPAVSRMMEPRKTITFPNGDTRLICTPPSNDPSRTVFVTRPHSSDGLRRSKENPVTKGAFSSLRLKPMTINKRFARNLTFKKLHGIS